MCKRKIAGQSMPLALILALSLLSAACSPLANSQASGQNSSLNSSLNSSPPEKNQKSQTSAPTMLAAPPNSARLSSPLHGQVIYGADNRHDLYAESDPGLRAVGDATVGIVRRTDLTVQPNGTVKLKTETFATHYSLCNDEPFREQDTAPFCSGFLIAPDLVVSAGHCVTNDKDCGEVAFVFGYSLPSPQAVDNPVPAGEIYNCAKLIHAQAPANGADFSILRLDRPVKNHLPLKLRSQALPRVGDDVVVLGYPSGLPLKIAGGAKIRKVLDDKGFFQANLDTYGGNSGSAVVNLQTLDVEGVLVRGERDFVYRPEEQCMTSNRCGDTECRGEDVTLIREIEKFL